MDGDRRVAVNRPGEPLPGQRRAPCGDHQREANGSCWRAFVMGDTPVEVAENCARSDFYEMEPGACVKRRIGYAPVPAPKPNSFERAGVPVNRLSHVGDEAGDPVPFLGDSRVRRLARPLQVGLGSVGSSLLGGELGA